MATAKNTKKTGTAASKEIQKTGKKTEARSASAKTAEREGSPRETTGKKTAASEAREEMILRIKADLLHQRETLLDEAETALNELPGQTIFPDLGDQASAETDRNFMLRLRGREQRLLKKIDEALDRIEGSTFGICEDCGNEIGIKRLLARPVTTMCIECKTLQEEEEKRREV